MDFKLILKKLNNTLNKEEEIIFDEWCSASKLHKNYFNRVAQNFSKEITPIELEKEWKRLEKRINKKTKKRKYFQYSAVASVILLLSLTILFNFNKKPESQIDKPDDFVNTPIKQGTDKATLTLDDGTQVVLADNPDYTNGYASSNGKGIVYASKPSKNNKPEVKYNELTIPRGGQYFLKLTDGTQVWLNSESKLKYPVNFISGQSRKVELLYGEAYFDVSPSVNHNGTKFLVKSGVQEIEVLGTEFNVKAYKDENLKYTTLVEGKIAVKETDNTLEILSPNEQLVLNKTNNDRVVMQVDVNVETAWKRGFFSFKKKSLKDIMKVLSRWYDVDVLFMDKELENEIFKGVLSKDQNLEEILTIIKHTNFINAYEIKNNTILIK